MRRALLIGVAIVFGLAAEAILGNGPDLYWFWDSWHSAEFTRMVGVAIIVEGALAALGAGLCLGRALGPLTPAPAQRGTAVPGAASTAVGGGPVLPICGILFLLAALAPCGQARRDSEALEVMDSMPGYWGAELVEDYRKHERTEWTFGVLWLVVGGSLLGTPLLLGPRVWRLGWRINGVGCGIALGGFLLSGMGALLFIANGLAMEGANKDLAYAGYLGVLTGAIVAAAGSIIAVIGKSKTGPTERTPP
jgi:hypothetical protein